MATITTRDGLKLYALRRLGAPVIQINVADEQLEERIDDALQYYHDMHFDGTERKYYVHEITADDITNGYFPVPDNLIYVTRVLDFGGGNAGIRPPMNDPAYAWKGTPGYGTAGADGSGYYARTHNDHAGTGGRFGAGDQLKSYILTQQMLETWNFFLGGEVPMDFTRHADRVTLHIDWSTMTEGQYLVAEGWIEVDPETYTQVYNDRWLKRYLTAMFKQQWGTNLKLYSGVQMPGGVTFDGKVMYDEATAELAELEAEMISTYQMPVDFFVG